jgi:hypothetical protein
VRWGIALTLVIGLLILVSVLTSELDDATRPAIELDGPEETVFDWTVDACELWDIPDSPPRAFRDGHGNVRLIAANATNRFMVGRSLDTLEHRCRIALPSANDADPGKFDDKAWIGATYANGNTVYALAHQEYQGHTHPGMCSSGEYEKCWYNSITFAASRDGGATFQPPTPPAHLVASVPYRYEQDAGPYGLFEPSNIVRNPKDGHYYVLVRAEAFADQRYGSCLLRTRNLSDPRSWRAWDGDGFNVRFENPYQPRGVAVSDHLCTPVAPAEIAGMSSSLTYSTYYEKFLLVGNAAGQGGPRPPHGFYFSLSDDLLEWSPRKLIREVEFLWTYRCGDRDPVLHPSVIDPDSRSRNFSTVDERAYLYFVRFHYVNCERTPDRDLVRIPIRFTK